MKGCRLKAFWRWLIRCRCASSPCACWVHPKDHFWEPDIELSTTGLFAVVAGLWWPPSTCKNCGETKSSTNEQYAEKNKWLKKVAE